MGASFNGSSSYLASVPKQQLFNDKSHACWVYFNATPASRTDFFARWPYYNSPNPSFVWLLTAIAVYTGYPVFAYYVSAAGSAVGVNSSIQPQGGQWYHLCGTVSI